MKKLLSTALILTLASTLSVCAYENKEERGYISVNAQVNKEYAPNIAKIRFYVETENKDLKIATDENKKTTQKALDAVKALLSTTKGDMIQTINFSASPQYEYRNKIKTFMGYKVTNGFQVTLKNVDVLGKVISAGLNNGANRVGDLNFSLDDNEKACNELIKEATSIVKTRAQVVAQASGSQIEGVKSLNASCNGNSSYQPRYELMNSKMMDSASAGVSEAMPTEMGTIKMYASANAMYYVK